MGKVELERREQDHWWNVIVEEGTVVLKVGWGNIALPPVSVRLLQSPGRARKLGQKLIDAADEIEDQ